MTLGSRTTVTQTLPSTQNRAHPVPDRSGLPHPGNENPENFDHIVQFYQSDELLAEEMGSFIGTGIKAGEAAVVIATSGHWESLVTELADMGLDVAELKSGRQLVYLDARETLGKILVDGFPDADLFRQVVGGLMEELLKWHPRIRAMGEMVALLWSEGNNPAAIRLEELWNGLGESHSFSLFCAYPMKAFLGAAHDESFVHICDQHSRLLPTVNNGSVGLTAGEKLRALALLQLKAAGLEAEIQVLREKAQLDLVERKKSALAEKRLAAIVESSHDAIISKDLTGIITSWNKGAERIFGYTAAEIIGKSVTVLIPTQHLNEEPLILDRIRNGDRVEPYETVRCRKNGSQVVVSLTVSPIVNEIGEIIGASKIVRDITEFKDMEAQLRQAQKMEAVGRLAGGIAHDFNNLLTAINGYSEMALGMVETDDPLYEYLGEVKKSGDRAAALTQQLLAFSRKQLLAPTVFDLNEAVSEMEKMLRRLIGEDIVLDSSLESDLGLVKADPGQVQQIILNLVLNARDAMPNGGKLTLETGNVVLNGEHPEYPMEATPGPHVRLSVKDSGIGMTPEVQAKIFEPFFTTKDGGAGTNGGRKGTGLGLASVYGIIKQSGGSISVTSEPGQGSAFHVFLPLAESQRNRTRRPRQMTATNGKNRGETILLVEDEETVRKFIQQTLTAIGYTVLEARDGETALEMVGQHRPIDLVLTDLVMPIMNGGKLAEKLKAVQPKLKVLFMSGYPSSIFLAKGFLHPGARFLQKPFSQAELLQKVNDMLQSSQQASGPE